MAQEDFYQRLGVSRTASAGEIKSAFRRIAMKNHPDRCPDDPDAISRFQAAKEAYDTLGDPEKRARYDRGSVDFGSIFDDAFSVSETFRHGNGQRSWDGGGRNDDVFGDFFERATGGVRGSKREHVERGADVLMETTISFKDSFFGTHVMVPVDSDMPCDECGGKGFLGSKTRLCSDCNGKGKRFNQKSIFSIAGTCETCGGRGRVPLNACNGCHGSGRYVLSKKFNVSIPAGIRDGEKLRFSGHGHGGGTPNAPRGDVLLVVRVEGSNIFQRRGDDLVGFVDLRFSQMILGGSFEVPLPDESVVVSVPPASSVGDEIRISGKGFVNIRANECGDLVLSLRAVPPDTLTDEQKKLLAAFEASFDEVKCDDNPPVSHSSRFSPHHHGKREATSSRSSWKCAFRAFFRQKDDDGGVEDFDGRHEETTSRTHS